MSAERLILTIPRAGLPPAWLPESGALALPLEDVVRGLAAAGPRWTDRPAAEHDPTHKQLIPYVLVTDRDDHLAAYPRRGSESRLHGLWSIGVGGHVEPRDRAGDLASTLLACAYRELAEELPGARAELAFLGVINEDHSGVGQVHWGLVFLARLVGERPRAGSELEGLSWLPRARAADLPLERWSRLALGLLIDPGDPRGAAHGPTPP